MSKTTAFVTHSDCSRHDTGWGQLEHQGRLPAVARAVYRDMLTLFEPLLEVEARPAEPEELRLAHTAEYLERLREAAERAGREGKPLPFEAGVMVSSASWDAARAGAGAVLTAVEAVLAGEVRNAFCAVRPPGHEAGPDHAGGHGLLNGVALAARHLRERRRIERVLIVDVGATGGRGTAAIVAADPGIRLLAPTFPSAVAGPDLLVTLDAALVAAVVDFPPDFLLVSLGFELLATDPLEVGALEPIDYFHLTGLLRRVADERCGGRVVSALEGGYGTAGTAAGVVQHLRALAGLPAA